jgi:CubicO group peptidase (beta-lactamase class C family)
VLSAAPTVAADPLDPELADAIRDYTRREMAAIGVPGAAVVIVRDDAIVFAEGFGRADAGGREVTPATPFDLASVSKSLTAIAVMRQVEAGALELDAPVVSYLPWFGDTHPALRDVTVLDLLGHQSGWTIGDGQANLADGYDGADAIERNVRRLAATEPTQPRGTFEYSNANYDVLAYLVEVSSGIPFADYIQANVFEPLDMRHAHVTRSGAEADGPAQGFYPFFGLRIAYEGPFIPGGIGSAFLSASAEDLGHAMIFHLNEGSYGGAQVLSPQSIDLLHTPISHPDASSGYAGGLYIYPLWSAGSLHTETDRSEYRVPIVLEHGGDHASFATGILVLPQERWGVTVLFNINDSAAPSRYHQLHYGIATMLLGGEAPETIAYEDAVLQYIRTIVVAVVLLQLIGIAWAIRRLRQWRRSPDSAPRGRLAVAAHLLPALALDLVVTAAFVWLYLDRNDAPFEILVIYAPDLAVGLVLIAFLGIGWGIVRTVLTLRVLRGRESPVVAPAPSVA